MTDVPWSPAMSAFVLLAAFGALRFLQTLIFAIHLTGGRIESVVWGIGEGFVLFIVAKVAATRTGSPKGANPLGLRIPGLVDLTVGSVAGVGLYFSATWLQGFITSQFSSWVSWYQEPTSMVLVSQDAWVILGGLQILAVAIGEETLFRGFIYRGFRTKYSVAISVILSSGLFAVAHFYPPMMPVIFVYGVVLALAAELRRSLALPMVIHATILVCFLVKAFPA